MVHGRRRGRVGRRGLVMSRGMNAALARQLGACVALSLKTGCASAPQTEPHIFASHMDLTRFS
jgi:hypothetical protein